MAETYDSICTLGEGAYGCVWKCLHKESGRLVAIKGFKAAHEDEEIMRLALREVKVLKQLKHPNVVELLEAFRSRSGRVYLVFPFAGRSAHQALDDYPDGMSPTQLRAVAQQVLRGLAYLHERKIVHRDVKPANILLSHDWEAKLCDFGFARATGCGPRGQERLTSYVVTRWYRAPEVLVRGCYGPAADMWSLGCTLAELATGLPLFPGTSSPDQLWRICRCFGHLPPALAAAQEADRKLAQVPTEPHGRTLAERLGPGTDSGMVELIAACLQLHPQARPTALEALDMPCFAGLPSPVGSQASATPEAPSSALKFPPEAGGAEAAAGRAASRGEKCAAAPSSRREEAARVVGAVDGAAAVGAEGRGSSGGAAAGAHQGGEVEKEGVSAPLVRQLRLQSREGAERSAAPWGPGGAVSQRVQQQQQQQQQHKRPRATPPRSRSDIALSARPAPPPRHTSEAGVPRVVDPMALLTQQQGAIAVAPSAAGRGSIGAAVVPTCTGTGSGTDAAVEADPRPSLVDEGRARVLEVVEGAEPRRLPSDERSSACATSCHRARSGGGGTAWESASDFALRPQGSSVACSAANAAGGSGAPWSGEEAQAAWLQAKATQQQQQQQQRHRHSQESAQQWRQEQQQEHRVRPAGTLAAAAPPQPDQGPSVLLAAAAAALQQHDLRRPQRKRQVAAAEQAAGAQREHQQQQDAPLGGSSTSLEVAVVPTHLLLPPSAAAPIPTAGSYMSESHTTLLQDLGTESGVQPLCGFLDPIAEGGGDAQLAAAAGAALLQPPAVPVPVPIRASHSAQGYGDGAGDGYGSRGGGPHAGAAAPGPQQLGPARRGCRTVTGYGEGDGDEEARGGSGRCEPDLVSVPGSRRPGIGRRRLGSQRSMLAAEGGAGGPPDGRTASPVPGPPSSSRGGGRISGLLSLLRSRNSNTTGTDFASGVLSPVHACDTPFAGLVLPATVKGTRLPHQRPPPTPRGACPASPPHWDRMSTHLHDSSGGGQWGGRAAGGADGSLPASATAARSTMRSGSHVKGAGGAAAVHSISHTQPYAPASNSTNTHNPNPTHTTTPSGTFNRTSRLAVMATDGSRHSSGGFSQHLLALGPGSAGSCGRRPASLSIAHVLRRGVSVAPSPHEGGGGAEGGPGAGVATVPADCTQALGSAAGQCSSSQLPAGLHARARATPFQSAQHAQFLAGADAGGDGGAVSTSAIHLEDVCRSQAGQRDVDEAPALLLASPVPASSRRGLQPNRSRLALRSTTDHPWVSGSEQEQEAPVYPPSALTLVTAAPARCGHGEQGGGAAGGGAAAHDGAGVFDAVREQLQLQQQGGLGPGVAFPQPPAHRLTPAADAATGPSPGKSEAVTGRRRRGLLDFLCCRTDAHG